MRGTADTWFSQAALADLLGLRADLAVIGRALDALDAAGVVAVVDYDFEARRAVLTCALPARLGDPSAVAPGIGDDLPGGTLPPPVGCGAEVPVAYPGSVTRCRGDMDAVTVSPPAVSTAGIEAPAAATAEPAVVGAAPALPQDDLAAHLARPRPGWSLADEAGMLRLHCLGWKPGEIAVDMDRGAHEVLARIELLTGWDRARKVRRFRAEAVRDRLERLAGVADG